MPPTWQEVQKSPEFRKLSFEDKEAAREQYFAEVVAPRVEPTELDAVREQFDAQTKTRRVGFWEAAARTVGSAVKPVVRAFDLAAAGLAGAMGAESDQEAIFRDMELRQETMGRQYDEQPGESMPLAGQVVGGVASMPVEMAGGFGVQRGIDRAAEVVKRGGSMQEAAVAGGVTGAGNVALNALPVRLGGQVAERVGGGAARQLGFGAATGAAVNVPGEVALGYAENAALPEREEFEDLKVDPLDPENLAVSAGLSAAFGAAGAGMGRSRRAGRKTKQQQAQGFEQAAQQHGFQKIENEDGVEVYRTPNGATITPDQWETASQRVRDGWLKPAEAVKPEQPEMPKEQAERLGEIDRLEQDAPEPVKKVLQAERKKIEQEVAELEKRRVREAEVAELERAATSTTDKGLQAALRARAEQLRPADEKIPAGEAKELKEQPPTGRAPDIAKLPTPEAKVEPPPTGSAPELKPLPVPEATVEPPPTGRAPELKPLPVPKVVEVQPEAPKPAKPVDESKAVLKAIRGAGGIDIKLSADIGEKGFRANSGRMAGVFRRKGIKEDRLAEVLHEQGFITDADMQDGNGARRAMDIVQRIARGEPVAPVDRMGEFEAERIRMQREREILDEAERRGIDVASRNIDDIEQALFDEDIAAWSRDNDVTADDLPDARDVARAVALDEAAVERAAIQHEDDIDAFRAAVRSIIERGEREGIQVAEGRKGYDTAAARVEAGAREPGPNGASEAGAQREAAGGAGRQGKDVDEQTSLFPTDAGPGKAKPPQPGQQGLDFPPLDMGDVERGRARQLMPDEVEITAAPGTVDAKAARSELREMGQRARNVTIGKFKAPEGAIDTPAKAAQVLAPMRRDTQEQIMALVTDENGKPLAVIRHSKGGRTATSAYSDSLIGAIAQVKGGRRVWFAHNHPSGSTSPSENDRTLQGMLEGLLLDTGMEVQGHMIIAGPRATFFSGRSAAVPEVYAKTMDIKPARRRAEVPVQENRFTFKGDQWQPVGDVSGMRQAVARAFKPEETGLLIMDSQLRPVGALPMTPDEMGSLRTGDVNTGAMRVMSAISSVGGTSAVIKTGPGEMLSEPVTNMANMLGRMGVRLVDATDGEASAAMRGTLPSGTGEFFSMRDKPGTNGVARNAEEFEQALRDKFGSKIIDGLKDQGILRIMRGADDASVPERARAVMREREGGSHARLYWDRIRTEDAPGILMHEIGEHFGIVRMLGEDRYQALLNDLEGLRKTDEDVARAWKTVVANYRRPDGSPMFLQGDQRFLREVAAHLVETQPDMPFVRRLINEIRAWLYEQFGTTLAGKVDANLIRGLAAAALRKAAAGDLDRMDRPVAQRMPADERTRAQASAMASRGSAAMAPEPMQERVKRFSNLKWEEASDDMMTADLPNGWVAAIMQNGDGTVELSVLDPRGVDFGDAIQYQDINTAMTAAPAVLARRITADGQGVGDAFSMAGPKELPEETRAEMLSRKFFDRFNRVLKAQKASGVTGEDADIVQADRLYHGRVQHLGDKLERDYIQPLGEMLKEAKGAGITVRDADDFLMALHAPERNRVIAARNPKMPDGGSGLTNQQAREIIEAFTPEQRQHLDQIAKLVHRMNSEKLEQMVDAGLITGETRDLLKKQYRYYVPLKTLDEEDAARGIGRGYEMRASDITTAMGRKSKAGSPIAASVMDASRTILRGEKARVDRVIWNFANTEDGAYFIRPYDPENPPREVMGRKIGPDGQVKDVVDPQKVQDLTIQVLVDGEPQRVFVPDELLRDQIRKVATLNDPGPVLRAVGRATGLVGRMLTEFNPAFTLPNAVRDAITAGMRAGTHGVSGAKVIAGIPAAWSYIASNKAGADTAGAKLYEEFKEFGGKTGAYGIQDVMDTMRSLERAGADLGYDDKKSGVARKAFDSTVGKVARVVSSANEVVEYASRLSLYRHMREAGATPKQAAAAAKEVTVNFNRSGEFGRTLNSVLVFANAALQGLYGTVNYAKNKTVQRNMLAMVALGAAGQAWNEWVGGENEDTGELNIDSQPDSVADKNVILLQPGSKSGVKIPLPPEYAALFAIGRRLFRFGTQGDAAREAGGIAANVLDATLPVRLPEADSGALGIAKSVTPTLIAPMVDIWTNQNYFGAPVVPEQRDTRSPAPYHTMSWDSTSGIAKEISRLANVATGGDDIEPGMAQKALGPLVSPEGIEHIVGHFTGGLGRFVMQSKDIAKAATEDKPLDINKLPIANRFVFDEPKSYIGRRYRELQSELEYAADRDEQGQDINEKAARALPEYEAAEKRLRQLRKEMRSAAQQGEDIEPLRTEMKEVQARVIRAYNGQPLD